MPELIELGLSEQHAMFDVFIVEKPVRTIYLLISEVGRFSKVVYVGQSEKNFFQRISDHINDENKIFNRVMGFNLEGLSYTLDEVEHALITFYHPKYNVALKGNPTKTDFLIRTYIIGLYKDYKYSHELDPDEYFKPKEEGNFFDG